MQSSSNLARESVDLKSMPSKSESISTVVDEVLERVRLARSQAVRRLSSCPSATRVARRESGDAPTDGTSVAGDVVLVLALEFLEKVRHEAVVKVLTTKVRVSGGRLDLEDALLDREQRNVERASPEVKDENVLLARRLLVELWVAPGVLALGAAQLRRGRTP